MQRVGFHGFARDICARRGEGFGARDVDDQSYQQDENGDQARLDVHAVEKQPVEAFVDDEERGDDEQRGFHEGGKILEFAVAVGMAVRRRAGRKRARTER